MDEYVWVHAWTGGWMAGWKGGRLLRVEPISLAYVAARDGGSDGAVVRVGLERSTWLGLGLGLG